jgi:hypothetical protein
MLVNSGSATPEAVSRCDLYSQLRRVEPILSSRVDASTCRCSLWRSLVAFGPNPVLDNSCVQPFLDDPQDSLIRDPVLQEPPQPAPIKAGEKVRQVGVEHPVHLFRLDPYRQRIQRLMRAAPWPEPVGEAEEVRLIDAVQHLDEGGLGDLVLQAGNATLPLKGSVNSRPLRRRGIVSSIGEQTPGSPPHIFVVRPVGGNAEFGLSAVACGLRPLRPITLTEQALKRGPVASESCSSIRRAIDVVAGRSRPLMRRTRRSWPDRFRCHARRARSSLAWWS